jgi:hypothetical protein
VLKRIETGSHKCTAYLKEQLIAKDTKLNDLESKFHTLEEKFSAELNRLQEQIKAQEEKLAMLMPMRKDEIICTKRVNYNQSEYDWIIQVLLAEVRLEQEHQLKFQDTYAEYARQDFDNLQDRICSKFTHTARTK